MDKQITTAGQGLGIAGLVLGILAIPLAIVPCTFIIALIFGITGIVLSSIALSQAGKKNGAKGLIIAALVCSILGTTIAALWGFTISRGARMARMIMRDEFHGNLDKEFEKAFKSFGKEMEEAFENLEEDLEKNKETDIEDTLTGIEKEPDDKNKDLSGEEQK
jgi:uncharacterized protein (DUF697 family)